MSSNIVCGAGTYFSDKKLFSPSVFRAALTEGCWRIALISDPKTNLPPACV